MNDKDARNAQAGLDELALLNMWRFLQMIAEEEPHKTIYCLQIFSDKTGRLEKLDPGDKGWIKVFFFNDFVEAIDKLSSYLTGIIQGKEVRNGN